MKLRKTLGEVDLVGTTKAIVELGDLAMKFGRVNRTCVVHPTGEPESDTDHTVMLSWIAPDLAEMINLRAGYERYPVGKVVQFCVVHDAVEAVVGDTPTHKISEEDYAAKESREAQGARQLYLQFAKRMPWFARLVTTYEAQVDPVARFVRSVDKLMPKIVHVLNASTDLVRAGLTYEDFVALYTRQRAQIEDWCPEPLLLQLYDELCGEVGRQYGEQAAAEAAHYVVSNVAVRTVGPEYARLEHPQWCREKHADSFLYVCDIQDKFDRWHDKVGVEYIIENFREGRFPVRLSADGLLEFYGKQED
jgi:5'-deoxynucleotidase YfbR-like HD superfamily hydrolase